MPLRVKLLAEPFTDYSKGTEPILATSVEYHRLRRALERYTNGLIQGRSYLISGHRGSGKTMLVHKAIEDLVRSSVNRESRPLFVRLHGPDLLPPIIESEKEPEKPTGKETPSAPAPKKEAATSAVDPAIVPGTPPATVPAVAPVIKTATASDVEKEEAKADKQLDIVLKQMMKSLFRDVTNEYRRCYREAILRRPNGVRRTDLLEVAAQFDLELTDYVTPSRLRNYWQRIGAFSNGILLTSDRTKYKTYAVSSDTKPEVLSATDIGLQEVLVLSLLSQAFQLIAGTVEEKQKQIDAAKDERSSSLTTVYALKNLFGPIAGLLTGGFVGVQIGTANPIAAVLLGLLTGAVVSLGFTYTSTRSKSREMSLESIFIKDRTVATLSSILPLLVVRLREIGLAPVFVVDELDKVRDLKDRMQNLVRHLKFLVTENSFSCFLTDRRYLDYLNGQASQNAYAPEYTYFSDRLVVLYRPAELRDFVRQVLEIVAREPRSPNETQAQVSTSENDRVEIEKISYVLLHRARMHPIDLRRQIDSLTGTADFSMADVFSSPRSRFEILMQVTIEWLLEGEDVQASLSGNPYYRQVVYDGLYYVSRLWEDAGADKPRVAGFRDFGTDSDKKPGLELNKKDFSDYIESRSKLEGTTESPKEAATPADSKAPTIAQQVISGKDFEFLFRKVGELLEFLCKPENLISEISRSQRQTKPPDIILNELPKDASLRLLIQNPEEKTKYRWLYDVSGRYLQAREVDEIINDKEVQDAISDISEVKAALTKLGVSGDLNAIADAKVLPRPSQWKDVVLPALDRLDRLRAVGNIYGNMDADRDAVVEFDNTLKEFEPNLKAALLSAAVFAPEISLSLPSPGARLSVALTQICRILDLSAAAEKDFRRLSVLLNSVTGPTLSATYDDELNDVLGAVEVAIKRSPASAAETNAIVKSAWDAAKTRFSKHFQDRTVWFDPLFEDVFTSIKQVGPGHELNADLSTITSRVWTKLLLRSLSEDKVPAWLRVAAAIELGLLDLADKLAKTVADDQQALLAWGNDARRNVPVETSGRRILVLAAEQQSLTYDWRPSMGHAALVSTVTDLDQLAEQLNKHGVSAPADYPIDLVAIELAGGSQMLGSLTTMKPQSAISEMSLTKAGSSPKKLDRFLNSLDVCYLVNEVPAPQASPPTLPVVVAPKGLDDLVGQFSGAVRPPSP